LLAVDLDESGRAFELCEEYILDLFALALGAAGERRELMEQRGACVARRAAVLRAIERRSGDPDLTPSVIAAELGITTPRAPASRGSRTQLFTSCARHASRQSGLDVERSESTTEE
jgi:hypothetical protein